MELEHLLRRCHSLAGTVWEPPTVAHARWTKTLETTARRSAVADQRSNVAPCASFGPTSRLTSRRRRRRVVRRGAAGLAPRGRRRGAGARRAAAGSFIIDACAEVSNELKSGLLPT